MSDQQKIWFIYLTDHHEGPFTPQEVAGKVSEGAVTAQSLGWKDGMPEWVPIESIPELAQALSGGGIPAPGGGAPAPAAGGDENFSLAALLAQQQGGESAPAAEALPVKEEPSLMGNTSFLSNVTSSVQAANPVGEGSVSMLLDTGQGSGSVNLGGGSAVSSLAGGGLASPAPAAAASSPAPGPDEEVWTLRVGDQVSGMHSLNRLKAMAGEGEVPQDSMLWRTGWNDFQPVTQVPEVAQARRAKRAGTTKIQAPGKTGLTRSGLTAAPAAAAGSDEPTDPGIQAAASSGGGFMGKIKGMLGGLGKRKAAPAPAPKKVMGAQKAVIKRGGGIGATIKRVAVILGGVGLLGGAVAAYFLFFSSPIPSDLDVIPDDLEAMKAVASAPAEQGNKLFLALARGTEDNPADDTAPKFYVATNLPEGSVITLTATGKPGTLVNRVSFEASFTANVGSNRMAVFEKVDDNGKPIPLGEYDLKLTAEGAEPLMVERFMGGRKGGAYADRLKRYKDKLQGEYDQEMQELRETIDLLKSLQNDVSRRIADYKTNWGNPGNRPRMTADWRSFILGAQSMAGQLEQKIKNKTSGSGQVFHPKAFQDVGSTLAQLQQLMQLHGQRLEGAALAGNPDELDGMVQAGVASLEQILSQSLVKSPIDVLTGEGEPAGGAPAPATAAPAPVPAAPAAVPAAPAAK